MSMETSVTDSPRRKAWSLREAADLIGASERFLRNEVRRGHLRVIRRSRRVFVPAASLDDYLRGGAEPQPAANVSAG